MREHLGLRASDEIEFDVAGDVIQVRKRAAPSPFAAYAGFLHQYSDHDVDAIVDGLRGASPAHPASANG